MNCLFAGAAVRTAVLILLSTCASAVRAASEDDVPPASAASVAAAPAASAKAEPLSDYRALLEALGKPDDPALEMAFNELGRETATDALKIIITPGLDDDGEEPEMLQPTSPEEQLSDGVVDAYRSTDTDEYDKRTEQFKKRAELIVKVVEEYQRAKEKGAKPADEDLKRVAKDTLRAESAAITAKFTTTQWLQVVEAFPFPLDPGTFNDLGVRLLANQEVDPESVAGDTLQRLKQPSRHFGLPDGDVPKRLRSALLLASLGQIDSSRPYWPTMREALDWPEDAAQESGFDKKQLLRDRYLGELRYDQQAVFAAPLEDVLELITTDLESEDWSSSAKIALTLLNGYRASEVRSAHIADVIARQRPLAEALRDAATSQASDSFDEALSSLRSFLGTKLTLILENKWVDKPLDEENNVDLNAYRAAIRVAERSVFVLQRMSKSLFESADEDAKAVTAESAAGAWLSLCRKLFDSYGSFDDPDTEYLSNADQDQKILFPVARREAYPVGRLLPAAPTADMLKVLPSASQREVRQMLARVASMEGDYKTVLRLCAEAAENRPTDARHIAENAVKTWTIPVGNAGRTPEARTRMDDKTPQDFGEFVAQLRAIRGLTPDEPLIMKTFTEFCMRHRPLSRESMAAVLPTNPAATEEVMRLYVAEMQKLLHRDRALTVAAKVAESEAVLGDMYDKDKAQKARTAAADEALETSGEYDALTQVIDAWRTEQPGWVGAMLQGRVKFDWAFHQLLFVEEIPAEGRTDIRGYMELSDASMRLMQEAADLCSRSAPTPQGEFASVELARTWFQQAYTYRAERATKKSDGGEIIGQIVAWLERLPVAERTEVRKSLAQHLLRQLFTPEEAGGGGRPKDVEVFYFVTGAVDVLGNIPDADEFRKLKAGYDYLYRSIRFSVVPEGSIYREGSWTGNQQPSFPVGRGEFGVWLTLQHTAEARERSGGFRRYARNQIENPGTALDSRAVANYANDMRTRLTSHLAGLYKVTHVEPLPKVEPLRKLNVAAERNADAPTTADANSPDDGQWLETPLYYLVLKPVGEVPPPRIPSLPLDLNFVDEAGLVVLPFSSALVDLDTAARDPRAAKNLEVKQRLRLNPRNIADGNVTLEITSMGEMIPPSPAELFSDLYSPDFDKEADELNEELITVKFNSGRPYAQVSRFNSVSMRWSGLTGETEFRFPVGISADDAVISRLVWWPGSLGESEGRAVPGTTYYIQNLPRNPLPWSYGVWIAGGVAGLGLAGWLITKLPRRRKKVVHRIPYQLPETVTPLRGVHILRRMSGDGALRLSPAERIELRADIHSLEESILAGNGESANGETGNGAHGAAPAAMLRRWLQTAQNAQFRSSE